MKTIGQFKIKLLTPDAVTVDKNWIQNTVSVVIMTLALCNVTLNDGTDLDPGIQGTEYDENEGRSGQNNNIPDAKYQTNEDGTEESGACLKGKYPVEGIVRHVETVERRKYNFRWYGYSLDADTVELPNHIRQHFVA